MAKREFLMLAHKYSNQNISGWMMSEKLDGQRCFWDGGITRGKLKNNVYWANTEKDGRYKEVQYCTGLWSRYGNVIHAPNDWLDSLPKGIPLDGELYYTYDRQTLRTIISSLRPDPFLWRKVIYKTFDIPPLSKVLEFGEINTTNFKKILRPNIKLPHDGCACYDIVYSSLQAYKNDVIHPVEQIKLPTVDYLNVLYSYLHDIVAKGGEGVMVRDPHAYYECCRSHSLLKVKKVDDMEGEVIGCTCGRRTALGSKLLGKMGALILRLPNGKEMELSGFTDAERELCSAEAIQWAIENPGSRMPDRFQAEAFPIGCKVTFHYRGKSNDGIPQEARYFRKWEIE